MTVAERLKAVRTSIEDAARRSARSPSAVTLVAVSKTWPADVALEAISAGVTDLGENRAQEFKEKVALLEGRARWHFIGPLQTNKVRQVVGACDLIHSVDRLALAEAIDRRASRLGLVQDVLIEVNVALDPSKHGIEPARAIALAEEADAMAGVRVRGLMTMPPYPDDPEESRPYYKELAALSRRLLAELPEAAELSMGMTRDFEIAVEEGATLVRIGTAIFGPR
jgi:pyridoxal phosphate enzyme (YggS family)